MIRGPRTRALIASLALAACSANASADDNTERIRLLEQKLEHSLQLIEALQQQVEALRAEAAGKAAPPAPEARVAAVERRLDEIAAAGAAASGALPLHGFADVLGGYDDTAHPALAPGRKGFALGSLDLYLTPHLGGQVRSLIELVFEMGDDGEQVTDLERAQIGYAFNDALTLWAGRYHNPYGYWNTAYHHGAQLQTSILRPRFIDFEDRGGILPAHGVGLWATGHLALGGQHFGYDAYLANAPSIDDSGTLDIHAAGREEFHAMSGLTLSWSPAPDLTVGIHGLASRVELPAGGASRVRMFGGFAAFDDGRWELIGEGYRFANRDDADGAERRTSNAWFVQTAYRSAYGTPFLRFERASLDREDRYFASQAKGFSYRRTALGLRLDLTANAALKLELTRSVVEDLPGEADGNAAHVQYAVGF